MASKDKPKKGAPPWMATFADMSTLLMTFFVLM
ncbi:MAG: flagellar motor protein MotB, partial [Deltaproteobacteria bacterium]|nr:flagellar motor protein MotB [Deltaproteobacteria bacterium]